MTEEQVFLGVDVEGGMGLLMQGTESDKLWPGADPMSQ